MIKEDSDIIINIINSSRTLLFKKGFSIDIFNIYDYQTLDVLFKKKKKMIILASVWLGQTRLIDNKKIFID